MKEIIVLNCYNILCIFGMWYFENIHIRVGFAMAGMIFGTLLIIKLIVNQNNK